jgi:pilus assembly protein Flp/PilA
MFGRIWHALVTFLDREDGPTAVEYAVLLALILMAVFAAVAQIGSYTSDMYNDLSLQGVKVKVP